VKRAEVLPGLERNLAAIRLVRAPAPADVERLTPADLSAQDRPILAAAIIAGASHFVTVDRRDFGRWMGRRTSLPLKIMTPRQFLTEVRP
jgi:hypothetical protein